MPAADDFLAAALLSPVAESKICRLGTCRLARMLQVRFQVEQSRDALQRQLAALDGQLHVAQARQEEAQEDNQVGL